MKDTATGRFGEFRGHVEGLCCLRPLGGGREWEASADRVRRVTRAESVTAALFPLPEGRAIGELPARSRVECSRGLESPGAEVDGREWADGHARGTAGAHTTFRPVGQTGFGVPPG